MQTIIYKVTPPRKNSHLLIVDALSKRAGLEKAIEIEKPGSDIILSETRPGTIDDYLQTV